MIKPTYLYIKRHSVTGKCYFGKTIKEDPVKYLGSGVHWRNHIRAHGIEYVETLWYKLFTDQDELTRVALAFSKQQDIVNSELWLNLKEENGIDSAPGYKHTLESREKISSIKKGVPRTYDAIEKSAAGNRGKSRSIEQRLRISKSLKGKPISLNTREASIAKRKETGLSIDHKEKLSSALLGRKRSKESIAKSANTRRGMKYHTKKTEKKEKEKSDA
jgi:hypothetical protein